MLTEHFLPTPATDMGSCKRQLSHGSRSFYFASHLLPSVMQQAACGLYAFCREADDLIDEGSDPRAALDELHGRLDRIYEEKPLYLSTDRVLTQIVHSYQLPRALLDALLEGFEWDASGRSYRDIDAVYDYSARVAGAVGVMMSVLMGVRDAPTLARAADLGTAMQLTNIARDVGEDARLGRIYLPLDELVANGIEPEAFLRNPSFTPELGRTIEQLLQRARALYIRADSGISVLPRKYQPGIRAARKLYSAIGDQVAIQGYNSVDSRAVVGTNKKLGLLLSAITLRQPRELASNEPALAQNQFLIDAVVNAPADAPAVTNNMFKPRALWMLDLFETLHARDRNPGIARHR
ncbi:MAG: phytoene synthase [Halieaceae bacterium]|jgi:phytoene synthase|nr:phytoene synthase [Halieaceae bacterium]